MTGLREMKVLKEMKGDRVEGDERMKVLVGKMNEFNGVIEVVLLHACAEIEESVE
jgi:hypothetical protein